MIKFYYDEDHFFPIWINPNMIVSVEPDKVNESYTVIRLANGFVTVFGLMDDIISKLVNQ